MANDRGQAAQDLPLSPPTTVSDQPQRRSRRVVFGSLIFAAFVGGVLADRMAVRPYGPKDLSWLDLDRGPLALLGIGLGCLAVAAAGAIVVFTILAWRFASKALETTKTHSEAMEGYKATNEALQAVLRPQKLGAMLSQGHEDKDAPSR
jgi:hypothetical protein